MVSERIVKRVARAVARIGMVFGAGAALSACYEMPPELKEGRAGIALPPGWPPLDVYDADRLHPANRWFHRVYSERDSRGRPAAPRPDLPYVFDRSSRPAERAELLALLGALEREPLSPTADPVSVTVLHADLLSEAERFEASDQALAAAYARAARVHPAAEVGGDARLVPPPLRSANWREVRADGTAGAASTAPDGSIYYDMGEDAPAAGRPQPTKDAAMPRRTALVRFRRVLDGAGKPTLAGVASEAWILEIHPGRLTPRILRFDRHRWRTGIEPWREVAPDETLRIPNPSDPGGPPLEGPASAVCLSCHRPSAPVATRRSGFLVR